MSEPILLAHDVGTSGTKSSLVDASGKVRASFAASHPTTVPGPGQAQQDPRDWWRGVVENSSRLARAHPDLMAAVEGIGVSGHMLGLVAVDAEGRPLRPAMIHSDLRSVEEARDVAHQIGAQRVYEVTGNLLDPRSVPCKMMHFRRHERSLYDATACFLQSKDYIVGCMTGRFDSTDFSDASHAQWIDIRRRRLATDLLEAMDLDPAKIPRLRQATDVVGTLTPKAAGEMGLRDGIPVVAGGGDGACASAGAGAVTPGDTYGCLGTTAWISTTTREPVIDPHGRTFNILSLGESNGVFGTVQSAGASLNWALKLIGERGFYDFDRLVSSVAPGCGGLIFLPYLEGERSPIFDPEARGVYFGICPEHDRAAFLRAALEGVSYALRSVLEVLRESRKIPALRLIGGGGQSRVWQEMLCEICRVEIQLLSTQAQDATSLGAALAAGCGVGIFPDLPRAASSIDVIDRIACPQEPDGAYDRNYRLYQSLYPDLKEAFARRSRALSWETQT
jgi:xylulokinase